MSEAEASLDNLYGAVLTAEAQLVGAIELEKRPQSRFLVDENSASLLAAYLDRVEQDPIFPRLIHQGLPFLWVIDPAGRFWLSLEEVMEEETGAYLYSLPRGVRVPKGQAKLGHPALVGGTQARIGGELWFIDDEHHHGWILSNKSGRFGYGKDRTEQHLENAADLIRGFKIAVEIDYIALNA